MSEKLAKQTIRNIFGSSQHGHLLDPVRPEGGSVVGGLMRDVKLVARWDV